ncbi:hypothetical protein BS47DRAFT_1369593 [Hydnum rufescens UP504]|uniref:Uncharacterized protein n=1 Tax=Hydnum rufescens UP504 TaxID=1448309 RepID=A0A9P6AEA2_9AGAM|nr:hypothetical protein BS47DRAFT_1369593 [Hydnum rufescens UP504]
MAIDYLGDLAFFKLSLSFSGITTNEDPWSEPPPEIKLLQSETRCRLNHLPNQPPLRKMTTQRTPDEPHPPKRMVKQNDNPPNEPAQHPPGNDDATRQNNTCQTKHANDDWPDQTQESTTHPLQQVCGNFKNDDPPTKGPNTCDPTERTRENDDPPTKRILQTATSRNHDASPGQTPHPLWRVCGNFKPWTNPTPAKAGVGILLNPHPPTEATTPPSENTRPWVRGTPMVKRKITSPGTTHLPKRYHTPARVEYHTPEWNETWDS